MTSDWDFGRCPVKTGSDPDAGGPGSCRRDADTTVTVVVTYRRDGRIIGVEEPVVSTCALHAAEIMADPSQWAFRWVLNDRPVVWRPGP